ncbi:hypothetical protein ITJ06_06750, partial [Clostridioides difficile]|nr:hypothetical protein [Clostridioides difficile]
KANIFMNQTVEDFCVLNYDDEVVKSLADKCNAKVIYFSRTKKCK